MDEATLAFYQQLYAGTPLYVVPESGAAAQPAAAPSTAPTAAPVAAAVAAPPAAPAAVVPAAPLPAAPAAVAAPVAAASAPVQPQPVQPQPAPLSAQPVAQAAPEPATPGRLPSLADLRTAREAAVTPRPVPEPTPLVAAAPPAVPAPAPAPPAPAAPPVRQPVPFDTLGSNANGLVLLVRLPPEDADKLPRIQRNVFLNNMLKAIQKVMEECVIVNVRSPYPVSLEDLRAQGLAVREVIGFGKNLLDVATKRTQPYEPVRIGDVAYLPAAEVEIIEYDNGRKKQLWQALQRMFLG